MTACTASQPPPGSAGPVEADRDFADAVHKGDGATAWSLLSSRTQAAADRAADAGHESGRQMLFTSALPGAAIEPRLVSQSGDSAEVQTSEPDGGAPGRWRVVRERDRWGIDLDLGH
ncbi:MAG: hypothetical protein ABR567_08140 [Myxococcales bacterium]